MKIFFVSDPKSKTKKCIVIIGEGLIGTAISTAISVYSQNFYFLPCTSYDAQDAAIQFHSVQNLISNPRQNIDQIEWVWSAGKAAFNAQQVYFTNEVAFFKNFLIELTKNRGHANDRLHLISSLGGLFEGQALIGASSIPQPCRPYGVAKLEMEVIAKRYFVDSVIYRPTSVFGLIRPGNRVGLITQLIRNTLSQRVTRVTGGPSTLRDYVDASDIGRYIAMNTLSPRAGQNITQPLASGKPSSLLEVAHLVKKNTQRSPYLQIDSQTNAADITVHPNSLPSNWRATDLTTSIGNIVRDFRHRLELNLPN